MTTFLRHRLWPAIALLIALTIVTGLVYPLVVTAVAQVALPEPGERLVHPDRRRPDDRLEPHRPGLQPAEVLLEPAVGRRRDPNPDGYDANASAGSNLGPTNQKLIERITAAVDALQAANGDKPVPVDLVTTSASGLDPDISPAAAEYQVARVAKERGMTEDERPGGRGPPHRAAVPRLPRRAARQRPAAQPRPRRPPAMTDPERDAFDVRPTADEMLARVRRSGIERPRPAAHLPRHGARGRQDVPDARGGPPPGRPRHGPRRRVRRGARPAAHPGAARRARGRARARGPSIAASSSRRWTPTPSSPAGRRSP